MLRFTISTQTTLSQTDEPVIAIDHLNHYFGQGDLRADRIKVVGCIREIDGGG